jgi:glycosyltransferase involved in cell wall biosynthesis
MTRDEGGLSIERDSEKSSEENPLISVLIVTYNAVKYLEEALHSIFTQTYKNIELIVVDGNSQDGTKEILKKHSEKIDYWISEPDAGQSNAFNKGFSLCSGALLTWLNSDELFLPDAIESVVKSFKDNRSYNWFTAGIVFTDEKLNIIKMRMGEGGISVLKNIGILNVYGSSTFFTKDLFFQAGGMNEDLHFTMDTDLWWRFSNMGEKFFRVKNYLCLYRLHKGSKTANYVVTGVNRKPEHQFEIDRLGKTYGSKIDNRSYLIMSKLVRNIFRLLSFSYMQSIFDSVRFKGKSSLEVFKIK